MEKKPHRFDPGRPNKMEEVGHYRNSHIIPLIFKNKNIGRMLGVQPKLFAETLLKSSAAAVVQKFRPKVKKAGVGQPLAS